MKLFLGTYSKMSMQYLNQIVSTGILFLCLIAGVSAADLIPYEREFIGTEWQVTAFLSGPGVVPVLDAYPITMTFSPDGWSFGSTGCNRYSSSYELEEGTVSLVISPLQMTRMACEQEAMDQEFAFAEAIATVASYSYDAESFSLNDANEQIIVILEPLMKPEPASLMGTTWNLITYGPELNAPLFGVIPTIIFSSDGTLSGTSGCNSFFGQYQSDEQTVSIGQIGSTLMACLDEEVGAVESAYLLLLQDVVSYNIDGNMLTLYNENAESILFFETIPVLEVYDFPFELRSFNVDGEVRYLLLDSTITLQITEEGTVSGSSGCNTYSTVAIFDEADSSKISIQPAALTMMFCDGEGIMDQESLYLSTLATTHSLEFDGVYLKLYNADGDLIATFVVASP